MIRLAPVLWLALLLACSGTTGPSVAPAVLLVDEAFAAPGDRVGVRLVNASDGLVEYNLCLAVLERQAGTGWHAAEHGRTCTTELHSLRPKAQAVDSRALPQAIEPGVYRLRLAVRAVADGASKELTLTSSEFEIR